MGKTCQPGLAKASPRPQPPRMITLSQSPTDPAFVQNPYPFYDTARAHGDFFYWEEFGMVCATSHRAVSALLRDRRLGREAPKGQEPEVNERTAEFYRYEEHSMLALEPPRHTRLRGLILRAFTSRRIAAMGPEIETLCNDLIDGFPKDAPFDLLDGYARVVPVVIIARLLGVPEENWRQLLDWSNAMVSMYQARRTPEIEVAASTATREFADYLTGYIAEKRKAPADDLITSLIAAEEDGEKLATDELITTAMLLLNAGHEATVHTIGNGVVALLDAARPAITPASVEEVIRFDPPLHMFTRWAYDEVEVLGHTIAPGDEVGLLLAAANRDPAAYSEPGRFDPARTGPANTSFGAGIHFCVGAPLARLELEIAFRCLFDRCPSLRLIERPRYANVYHFHGLETLKVRL